MPALSFVSAWSRFRGSLLRNALLLWMALGIAVLPLTSACGPAWGLRMRENRDTNLLAAAATDYWTMVRWNDPGRAAAYLATPEEKLRLSRLLGDPQVRMTDAIVLQVVVGEELPEERLPTRREGVAAVRIEGYDIRKGRLTVETLEQHWVKADRGWQIDAAASPLGADRPW